MLVKMLKKKESQVHLAITVTQEAEIERITV
jgi:hypothetical protein